MLAGRQKRCQVQSGTLCVPSFSLWCYDWSIQVSERRVKTCMTVIGANDELELLVSRGALLETGGGGHRSKANAGGDSRVVFSLADQSSFRCVDKDSRCKLKLKEKV